MCWCLFHFIRRLGGIDKKLKSFELMCARAILSAIVLAPLCEYACERAGNDTSDCVSTMERTSEQCVRVRETEERERD